MNRVTREPLDPHTLRLVIAKLDRYTYKRPISRSIFEPFRKQLETELRRSERIDAMNRAFCDALDVEEDP